MSIFQQYLQPPKSMVDRMAAFADLDARKEELTARRQQNALQALTMRRNMEADEVAREDRNQLQVMAQASGGDQNALIKALQGSGRISLQDRAAAMIKARDEQRILAAQASEREANAAKIQFANEQDRHKAVLEAVSSATDQASYARAVQSLAARGLDVSQVPQQFSPEFVSQAGMQALTALQRLNAAEKAKDQQIVVRGQDVAAGTAIRGQDMVDRRTREEGAASRSVQRRGQNMADARSRESLAAQREASATVYDPERGMLVSKATGLARPASTMDGKPIGLKDKPLTEGQAKAFQFATRMEASNNILAGLEKDGKLFSTPGSRMPFVGAAVNVANTEKAQKLDQAKRDFINAILRRESGAVISDQEFDNAEKQYFPQIGDDPGVVSQKSRNRKLAIEGVKIDVPRQFQDDFSETLKRTQPGQKPASGMPAMTDIDAELRRRGAIK
jgi:hypothetical protein